MSRAGHTERSSGGASLGWPYVVLRESAQYLPGDPVIEMPAPPRDFALKLSDGRRVVGHVRGGEWSAHGGLRGDLVLGELTNLVAVASAVLGPVEGGVGSRIEL